MLTTGFSKECSASASALATACMASLRPDPGTLGEEGEEEGEKEEEEKGEK